MTVELAPATCPRCGTEKSVNAIYIRDGDWEPGVDNLVCFKSCREGDAPLPHDASPSRRIFGGRR